MSEPVLGAGPAFLSIAADALAVRELTGWLSDLLAPTGAEAPALQARIELAVHEVCMNVIDHAYGPHHVASQGDVILEGELDPSAVRIAVRDHGRGFDLEQVAKPVPGSPQIRGYGLVIVEKLADEVAYTRCADTNIFSLRFDRAPQFQERQS